MTKLKKTENEAIDIRNIDKSPEPMYSEDFFNFELPKNDLRLMSSDSVAVEKINNHLMADARRKIVALRKIEKGIEGLHEKWQFWNKAKKDYKNSIDLSMSYQSASGVVSMENPGKGIWLDALIDNELEYYREELRVEQESISASQPVSNEDMMKVVYLYETGVIKFLEQRMGCTSNNKLKEIVARITGAHEEGAKTAMRRLPKGNQKELMKEENHIAAIGYIRDRKFNMKPLSKIKFDNDELD